MILLWPSLVKIFSHQLEHSNANWCATLGILLYLLASSLPSRATCRYAVRRPNWWKYLKSFWLSSRMLFKCVMSPCPKRKCITCGVWYGNSGFFQSTLVTNFALLARSPSKWSSFDFQSPLIFQHYQDIKISHYVWLETGYPQLGVLRFLFIFGEIIICPKDTGKNAVTSSCSLNEPFFGVIFYYWKK